MTQRNLLRLPEDRILTGQLQLLLANARNSLIPAIIVALVLAWALSNDQNAFALTVWCSAAILAKLACAVYAWRPLLPGLPTARLHHTVRVLIVLHAIEGAAWGALAWVALGNVSMAGTILVIAAAAGIAGSSMSAFAPVLPVYLVFSASIMAVLAARLWLLDETAYRAMGVLALLYVPMLFMQARGSANAARAAIELRFENLELVKRLRVESERAQSEHREAEEANLGKSKFLAAASHDLRQPLHAVTLFVEALRHEPLPESAKGIVENLGASAHVLEALFNELLDLSRVESGFFKPRLQVLAVQELFDALAREFLPIVDARKLELGFVPTRLCVVSDPNMLGRVLRNLITNAIRYTEQGAILVGCRRRGDRVAILVSDTGPGIPPEHHQAIFREFFQLGNPERDRRKGLGLGLAIVDGLCRVLDHPLTLRSTVGHGTTFSVSAPRATAGGMRAEAVAEPGPDLTGFPVLVIDDDPEVRAATLLVLSRWGCPVQVAESAAVALVSMGLSGFAPAVLLVDHRLRDDRTGSEAIREVRRALGRDLPAIIITGDTTHARLHENPAEGVFLLHKPVDPRQLRIMLGELCPSSRPALRGDDMPV